MCRISVDTIIRANRRTIEHTRSEGFRVRSCTRESINVSVSVAGKVFRQEITRNQLKESFKRAMIAYGR